MLSIFRTNQLPTGFLYIVYLVVLRLPGYIFPDLRVKSTYVGGYFANVVESWFGNNYWALEIFILALLVFQAFLINIMVQEHRITREVTLYPGLFYLLVVNSVPAFFQATGPLIANTFIIYALWQMMAIYRKPACADSIFNIGLAIGIGSLFYLSIVSLVIWGLLGLTTLRAFKIKEFLILISGVITPYILVFTWMFWTDQSAVLFQNHFGDHFGFNGIPYVETLMDYWVNALMLILVLTVLLSGRVYMMKQNIPIQKKISIVQWSLLFLILSFIIQMNFEWEHWIIAGVPFGIFVSMNFYHLKRGVAESLHMVWFVIILFLQFLPLLA
ncbi:MAG: hypothetical protein KDC24_03220 [Saprospiraceae bacterium]|nr:hypothetical protein [Saprospiraceae bacterium]